MNSGFSERLHVPFQNVPPVVKHAKRFELPDSREIFAAILFDMRRDPVLEALVLIKVTGLLQIIERLYPEA